MSGDLASGGETVVADHVVSHLWEHTYLLWFDDQLTPHSEAVEAADCGRASLRRNGASADKACGCGMARFGPVAAALRIRELR